MATKSTRILDPQGRINLPSHIREALNLAPGNRVEMRLEDDGTIRLSVKKDRCALCGESVEGKHHTKLGSKFVCYKCAQNLAREMMK